MSLDVYQPCPFCKDTDKKIKFCCAAIADDMTKIMRQLEGGQHRAALKRLEKLAETHPDTVWNEMMRAIALADEDRDDEAVSVLRHLYDVHPEHPTVATVYAELLLEFDGFSAARDMVWRALRKAHAPAPNLTNLLVGIAAKLLSEQCFLAARQFLTVALRLAPDDEKQKIFMGLMELDSDFTIPYPLRGVHSLRPMTGEAEREEAARKATRLAERGCFGPAADRFAALAESQPADAAAEYNTGLCRAWAADQSEASEAFLRAARAESDFEIAAEYAVLAQLLRSLESNYALQVRAAEYRIDSVDRVAEAIDRLPTAVRRLAPPAEPDDAATPDAIFELTNRPVPDSYDELALEDLPRRIGYLAILGPAKTEGEAELRLICEDADHFDECWKIVSDIIGSAADSPLGDAAQRRSRPLPLGFREFLNPLSFPASLPNSVEYRLRERLTEQHVENWLQTPQELLDDLTPEQAAKQPERQVEVAGLVYLLDVALAQQQVNRNPNEIRARLGLPEISSISPEADQSLHSYSTIQMHRLRVKELDDRQLGTVMNRALLIHYGAFLRAVLLEMIERDEPRLDRQRTFSALAKLARERGDIADGLHWIEEGRRSVSPGENAFVEAARWDLLELALRLDEGDSPEFQEYLRGMITYYRPKLPEVVKIIEEQLTEMGIDMPVIESADGHRPADKALWTPDQPGSSGQKLWLPGQ